MSSPTDSLVRVRVKSPDVDTFVERFARNVSRRSIFLPSREVREVGSVVRFEIRLVGGEVAFAGEGTVTFVKEFVPAHPTVGTGIAVRFTTVAPEHEAVLDRLVKRREGLEASGGTPASGASPHSAPSIPLQIAAQGASAELEPARSESDILAASVASLTIALPVPSSPMPPVQSARVVAVADPSAPSGAHVVASREQESAPKHVPSVPVLAPEASSQGSLRRRSAWALGIAFGGALAIVLTRSTAPEAPTLAASTAPLRPPSALAAPTPTAATKPASQEPISQEPATTKADENERRGVGSARPGIQVDEVFTGPTYQRFACPGATSEISLAAHGQVNVCFRVAQQTDDEEVTVVWKHDAIFMKTAVSVPPKHPGYRTRAFIPLYKERLGDWSVRILSSKGVELASTTFHVGP